MEKVYYSLSEIILGLRDEYQKHQNELRKLKELCVMDKKKAVDFRFSVFQSGVNKLELNCDFIPRQNKIQKLIINIYDRVFGSLIGKCSAVLVNENNRYRIVPCYKDFPVYIKNDGKDIDFYNMATEILNSEFSNNIQEDVIEFQDLNNLQLHYKLVIEQRFLTIHQDSAKCIWYNPHKDTISFISFDKKMSCELIEAALDIKVPKDKLSNYQIGLIDTSETMAKPIKLERIQPCKKVEFSIQEEEKQVVLSKVRNIK